MKVCLIFFLAFSFVAIAAEQYGVYDIQGNFLSSFNAEQQNLQQQIELAKQNIKQKHIFVSAISEMPLSKQKPINLYSHKTGLLTYIETKKGEVFSICPKKNKKGTWISDNSVSLMQDNCLVLQSPQITGTFYVTFINENGKADTTQILVNQAYIDMSKYSHKVWRVFPEYEERCNRFQGCRGDYEQYEYTQPLVVDKTEFTMAEAKYYEKFGVSLSKWSLNHYPKDEELNFSQRPYIEVSGGFSNLKYNVIKERNKTEGLDSIIGYRTPTKEEWVVLMRAGASTKYYWGDDEDSATVAKYAWVRPIGFVKPVARLQPNQFGLYDMMSPNPLYIPDAKQTCNSFSLMPECKLQTNLLRSVEYMGYPEFTITEVYNGGTGELPDLNELATFKKTESPPLQKLWKKVKWDISIRFLRNSPKMEKLDSTRVN